MLMHVAWKYCFYKIVCSVMQSDKHCQEHTKHKEILKPFCVCQIYCNPNSHQNKVPLSLEFNPDLLPIQASTDIMMNACFPLGMTDLPVFLFFVLWLQIFIIVFQQRFFKCLLNYCGIKAL